MTTDKKADTGTGRNDDIRHTLGLGKVSGAQRRRRAGWFVLVAAGGLLVILAGVWTSEDAPGVHYKTALAQRADLTVSVTATGTLQPLNQVDVGTEVSGTVKSVDVDFNQHVKIGEVLARLDTEQLAAKLRQSQAALVLARAKVDEAEATIIETRAKFKRVKSLSGKGLSSQADRDTAEAAYARARASQSVARAQVVQAQAQVDADRFRLDKTVIHSPINGIVLRRQVEPGQTVAASLQTPVLFTLAENLAQMELNVAVDEADVGHVKVDQPATFTVDAYPNRTFPAIISQVRYAPQTVQGVVTYETVLRVDNRDLTLRPGMTATVDITVDQRKNVLLVPNAALRFTPPALAGARRTTGGSLFGRLFPRRHREKKPGVQHNGVAVKQAKKRIWVLQGGQPRAVAVNTGASDGQVTQILSGDLAAGTPVLIDAVRKTK